MFVDSDDMLKPGSIEALCDEFDKGGCDYVTASYDELSEDGSHMTPIRGRRRHGAPWGRLFSRDVWRDLRFPEGFWFEDTVLGFCVEPRFCSRYLNENVYLYRINGSGITATAKRDKKGLDTFWIIPQMLEWGKALGIPFDQGMYDRVIQQLGGIVWGRTAALSGTEMRALFTCACDLVDRIDRDHAFICSLGGRWTDVERALRNGNFRLWEVSIV